MEDVLYIYSQALEGVAPVIKWLPKYLLPGSCLHGLCRSSISATSRSLLDTWAHSDAFRLGSSMTKCDVFKVLATSKIGYTLQSFSFSGTLIPSEVLPKLEEWGSIAVGS